MASISPVPFQAPPAIGSDRLVAVIDIGTTAIRMAIGQISETGQVETLEVLSQAVNLGKDTFSKGSIEASTTEQCVRILKSYREFLGQYEITDDKQLSVVATSAVREAANRLAFLNRVFVATGLRVEPLDEAEANRITYLGVQPLLTSEPRFAEGQVLVSEVGGGSTEILLLSRGDVSFAHTYRFGSLRLRKALEAHRSAAARSRAIMEDHIARFVEQVRENIPHEVPLSLIALGGDIRFAAAQIHTQWEESGLAQLPLGDLETLVDEVLNRSVDDLVRQHHLSFPDAETLGPALLTYGQLGIALGLQNLFVSGANLRDGLLQQLASPDAWSEEFKLQIVRSAREMGRRFRFDETHAGHVADLSVTLFRALRHEHQLDASCELLLYIAALLHDIGYAVSQQSHHKHSMYLINNGDLFGLSRNQILLVALVARYHRRAAPKPIHEGYDSLDWESRINVTKMAALLRVADALDRSNHQRVDHIECHRENGRLVIFTTSADDLSLEQMALKQKGTLFEEVFGLRVELRNR